MSVYRVTELIGTSTESWEDAAASAIRALERADAPWVPIVAVTANAFKEDIDRTTRAGMDGHVSKPIQVEQLSLTLQKIVQERASRVDGAREKEEGHAGR